MIFVKFRHVQGNNIRINRINYIIFLSFRIFWSAALALNI